MVPQFFTNRGVVELKSIELFVGAGGLGIASHRAGFRPEVVLDWDRWACETLTQNKRKRLKPFTDWNIQQCDVRDFDFGGFEDIDLVTGGPPCQPFSMGGKHRAAADTRDMFPDAVRAVRELQPKAFVFENVKGLTRATFASYLEYIKLQLRHPEIIARSEEDWSDHLDRLENHETSGLVQGLHYNLVLRVLNAADYGVPQKRERVFIVGFRSDLAFDWHFPAATHSQDALLWSQYRSEDYWDRHRVATIHRPEPGRRASRAARMPERPQIRDWMTVRDAISDLPDPEAEPLLSCEFHNHVFIPGARSYPGHTGSPLDEPAKTLKAGVHGVPGGENMLRRPDGSIRYFTVRESARLQTFPDKMRFHGSWTETMRQLGNAVPCDLAEAVLQSVCERLKQAS